MRSNNEFGRVAWLGALFVVCAMGRAGLAQRINVVVWDERQPKQKVAYPAFLGNQIASYLRAQPGLSVQSVGLDDVEQGLSAKVLDDCNVLVWWGHVRQHEVSEKRAAGIVERVRAGKLSLIVLHSAHWSMPFMVAMESRAMEDARKQTRAKLRMVGKRERRAPKRSDPLTPALQKDRNADGVTEYVVTRPNCCFPAYRPDGAPSRVTTLLPDHPIAKGIPREFTIPHTEMYDEPFHVPPPDQVVFEERWDKGERFRAGMVWELGKGKLFYFRPGHETYKVFFEKIPLQVIENAVRWLGAE